MDVSEPRSVKSQPGIISLACCAGFYGSFLLFKTDLPEWIGRALCYSCLAGGLGFGILALYSPAGRNTTWAILSLVLFAIVIVPFLLIAALNFIFSRHL